MGAQTSQSDLHNRLAGLIVGEIVRPVIESGGATSNVLVLLESVVAGVLIACAELDGLSPAGRDALLMALEAAVRDRLAEIEARKR